jgi:hypothetical protein
VSRTGPVVPRTSRSISYYAALVTTPAEHLELLEDPTWVFRRKESVELLAPSMVRHRISVDFAPPAGRDELPLFLLRKATGQLTRFDLVDEDGRSLPLPTRDDNATVSAEVLVEAARRLLEARSFEMTPRLETELRFIARSEPDDALAIVRYRWPHDDGPLPWWSRLWRRLIARFGRHAEPPWQYPENKTILQEDPSFRWLLRTLAHSCIVAVPVSATGRPTQSRRILKCAFDEEVNDLTRQGRPLLWQWLVDIVGRVFLRLGWRGYQVDVLVPYAGARSFHLELFVPDGVQILEAGLRGGAVARVAGPRKRVHLYVPQAAKSRTMAAFAQTRITGHGFTGSAFVAAASVTVSIGAAWLLRHQYAGQAVGAGPSLLLLFPGLIATYLTRPEHPVVTRHLRFARWVLGLSALLAYVAAARLAILNTDTTEAQLRSFFEPLFWLSVALTAVLLLSWRLPAPLSSRLRRPFRWAWQRVRRLVGLPDL